MIDTIIQSFDIWTDAQGIKSRGRVKSIDNISLVGIDNLRAFVIELALRGKLITQKPTDEPASHLLKRVVQEKEKLIAEGEIGKQKPFEKLDQSKMPYLLPIGWEWAKFSDLYFFQEGPGIRNWQFRSSGIKLLNVQNIVGDKLILANTDKYIDIDEYEQKYRHFTIKEHDLVFASSGGSWGKSAFFQDPGYKVIVNTSTIRMHPYLEESASNYLKLFLDSKLFKDQMKEQLVGIQPNFGSTHLLKILVPVPPAREQSKIASKVDELMALCDKLEEEQTNNLKTHQTLVKALLETLTQAKDADELQTAWQRMLLHFDTLFCTEDSIDQLKQTILQLAIMGRLVKQDPNDEPAITLLKRIKVEKGKLIKIGELKKEKSLTQIIEDETPFELPEGWVWSRLEEITKNVDYGTSEKADMIGDIPVLRMGNIQDGKVTLTNLKYVERTIADLPRLFLKERDLIFNRTNSFELVGKCGIYEGEDCECTFASYLIRVSVLKELVSIDYINFYINSRTCRSTQIEPQITQQTGQANFSGSKLKNILFPLPPVAEQQRIVAKMNELFKLCDSLKDKIKVAQEIKVSLSKTIVENTVA